MSRVFVVLFSMCLVVFLTDAQVEAKTKPCQSLKEVPSVSDLTRFSPKIFDPASDEDNVFLLHKELVEAAPTFESDEKEDVAIEAKDDLAALTLKSEGSVSPYVGAGMNSPAVEGDAPGLSAFEAEQEAEHQSYRLGAGLNCALGESGHFELGYRYSNDNLFILSEVGPTSNEPATDDHHISFGLKFGF